MDFDKIKSAVETIELSDRQKEEIINSCSGKKRKFNYKPLVAVAAAAAVVIVFVSPGFLFKASSPNESADMLMDNIYSDSDFDFYYTADDAAGAEQQYECNASATTASEIALFKAEGFADIYSVIPCEFSSLVDAEEYRKWSDTLSSENGMAILQFVTHFGISKEAFDTANTEYNTRTLADQKTENNYFNSEIIYSFDRKQIDSFYAK